MRSNAHPQRSSAQLSSKRPQQTLETLAFMHHFATLPTYFFSRIAPTGFDDATLVHVNLAAAALLDLDSTQTTRKEFAEYFGGKKLLPGADPIAAVYAGHQFGH